MVRVLHQYRPEEIIREFKQSWEFSVIADETNLHESLQLRCSKAPCFDNKMPWKYHHKLVGRGSKHFTLKASPFCKKTLFFPLLTFYYLNVDDLANQLYQIKRVLERKEKSGMLSETLLEFVILLEPFKMFHKLLSLGKIVIVIPVSSASCERSFSVLSLIKNHLRTTMTDEHLNHLDVMVRWICG